MLRGILRNVQYLLLFFSVLLVFIALQRLQNLPNHYYNSDGIPKPDELKSSFSYGRGGDTTREIGLRSFRIGIFKFILPSFISSPSAYQNNNDNSHQQFLTVPPPNDRPKSVAYIITLSASVSVEVLAKVAKTIQRMHEGSKYEYRLYALAADGMTSKQFSSSVSLGEERDETRRDDMISKLGFEIVNSSKYGYKEETKGHDAEFGNTNGSDTSYTTLISSAKIGNRQIHRIWRRHNVIVTLFAPEIHSSWTLDRLFDLLLYRSNNEGVDLFLLRPAREEGREIVVFTNGSSRQQSFEKYLKFLFCVASSTSQFLVTDEFFEDTDTVNKDIAARGSNEDGHGRRQCIDQIESDGRLATCTYHEDYIDCSDSILSTDSS